MHKFNDRNFCDNLWIKFTNEGKCVLGWSGSHSTSQFLYLLKDVLIKLNKKIPPEILTSISSIDDPGRLADTIAHGRFPLLESRV